MRIGMTYDLRDDYLAAGMSEEETAEFDKISTIEAIENAIQTMGHEHGTNRQRHKPGSASCQKRTLGPGL